MPRLLLLAAALLFSTGGVAIKGNSLTSLQVASFRSAVAAIFLLLLFPAARRGWSRRLIPIALAYAATLILFVQATKLTTSANAIFLQSTAPAYLLLLGPLLLREPVRRADWLVLAGVSTGMLLFFVEAEPARATAPDPVTGNVLAAFSGVAWACVLAGLRWFGRERGSHDPAPAAMVLGNLLASALALPGALPVERADAADFWMIVYLGTCQIGLAYLCLARGMRDVPAFEASTILLIEPALNPIWTWLVLRERPGPAALWGGAIILATTLANTWRQSRRTIPRRS